MKTLAELLADAESLLNAGKLDEFDAAMKTYHAAKALEDAKQAAAPAAAPADPPASKSNPKGAVRLPFAPSTDPVPATETDTAAREWAAKTLYQKKYGTVDAGFEQVARELYADAGGYFYLSAVKSADFNRYLKTGTFDPRLEKVVLLTPEQIAMAVIDGVPLSAIKATMIEAQDTLGGYLVPEDFQVNEVISRLPGLTVVRSRATVRTTTRDVYSLAKRTGGNNRYIGNVRVYPVDETPAAGDSDTNATYGKTSIPIHTLMADVTVSKSVLEDAAVDLGKDLGEEFSTARAIYEDELFLIGNGIAVPRGILLDGTTGGPSSADTAVINSGHATSIPNGDAIKNVPYNLDAQYRQNGAVWIMSKGSRRVIATLKTGDGNYLWADRNGQLQAAAQDKLEGYQVAESEALASPTATNGTTYAANVHPVVFGDLKGYRVVDRIGMSVQRYEDFSLGRQDSIGFIMRWRGGGDVTNGERFVVLKVAA